MPLSSLTSVQYMFRLVFHEMSAQQSGPSDIILKR